MILGALSTPHAVNPINKSLPHFTTIIPHAYVLLLFFIKPIVSIRNIVIRFSFLIFLFGAPRRFYFVTFRVSDTFAIHQEYWNDENLAHPFFAPLSRVFSWRMKELDERASETKRGQENVRYARLVD